jgi:hypothetical protein
MTGQHTPGPWRVHKDPEGQLFILGPGTKRDADCIATISPAYKHRARLIAAAPELLEALKLCQVRVFMAEGSENEAYRAARAAIAKAKP